jgi:hypothetical protein
MRLSVVTPILDPTQLFGPNDLETSSSDSEIRPGTQAWMSFHSVNDLAAAVIIATAVLLAISSEIISRFFLSKSSPVWVGPKQLFQDWVAQTVHLKCYSSRATLRLVYQSSS